jgi:co-chaperonin GroES (HSP10)
MFSTKIKSLRTLHDYILVTDMNFDQKLTTNGIIIPGTNGKLEGIHPRWGRVYAVGKNQTDVKVGQYILIRHGRWSRAIEIEEEDGTTRRLQRVDNKDIMLVSDTPVVDENIGTGM